MPVHIRSLAPHDRSAWELLWRGYQDFYGVSLEGEATQLTWRRIHDPAEPVQGLGAFDSGRLLGIAHTVTHRSTWMTADTCYLQDLYVAPDARGQGVARALIEAVYNAADASGVGQVYWLTHRSNVAARRVYDRLAVNAGFVLYERRAESGDNGSATDEKEAD
jgi:GNAT superfamily N-acetyltransferase